MNVILNLEGTLEELTPILTALQATNTAEPASSEVNQQEMSDEQRKFVSPEFLRRALKRHPLTKNTLALLKSLYEAEKDGFLSRETLRNEIGSHTDQKFSDQQLTGVLGSFGKRIHQTPRYNKAPYLHWKKVDGNWRYRLPEELQSVVAEILQNSPIS